MKQEPHMHSATDGIETLQFHGLTYYLPKTEEEVASLIKQARAENKKICVRGSGHSFPMIPDLEAQKTCLYILMSNFNSVTFDDAKMEVTAGGGCNLGRDPFDPTQRSTLENSLFYQVFKHGWAIPEMGGIIHQTVGGFISTGSSGGSVKYSFDELITRITIMTAEDPEPQVRTFSASDADTDDFYAAGIAMGLFGVILSVTFKCIPTFNIKGTETISTVKACSVDLFGSGSNDMQAFLTNTDYTRFIWWPQPHVDKMTVWQAEPIPPEDGFEPDPYEEVPPVLGSEIPASVAADLVYSAIGYWPDWFLDTFDDAPWARLAADAITAAFFPILLPRLLDIFVPIDDPEKGPQQFQDYWWSGLCMDNKMNDKLLPIHFTELWIPLAQSQSVMNELKAFFSESTENTGTFCLEIYAARASKFWMSPSYGTDVIRLDVFWFSNTNKDPVTTLFQRYWDRFGKYDFRCHWGKYLPGTVNGQPGAAYLESRYPHWQAWMAKRAAFDPDNVFVNEYWQTHLGLA